MRVPIVSEWYLIRTKVGRERSVQDRLRPCLAETLVPMLSTAVYRSGRLINSIAPLFPCYVFARFDFEQSYVLVKYSPGVRELVCGGSQPFVVPSDVIESLQRRCSEGPIRLPSPQFAAGASVRVKEGPFRGFEAIFERYLSGAERVAILLSSLDRLAPRVILPARALELLN